MKKCLSYKFLDKPLESLGSDGTGLRTDDLTGKRATFPIRWTLESTTQAEWYAGILRNKYFLSFFFSTVI